MKEHYILITIQQTHITKMKIMELAVQTTKHIKVFRKIQRRKAQNIMVRFLHHIRLEYIIYDKQMSLCNII